MHIYIKFSTISSKKILLTHTNINVRKAYFRNRMVYYGTKICREPRNLPKPKTPPPAYLNAENAINRLSSRFICKDANILKRLHIDVLHTNFFQK